MNAIKFIFLYLLNLGVHTEVTKPMPLPTSGHLKFGSISRDAHSLGQYDGSECSGVAVNDQVLLTVAHCLGYGKHRRIIVNNQVRRYRYLNVEFIDDEILDGPVFIQITGEPFLKRDKLNVRALPKDYAGKLTMKCYPGTGPRGRQQYVVETTKKWRTMYRDNQRNIAFFSKEIERGCSGGAVIDNTGSVVAVVSTVVQAHLRPQLKLGLFPMITKKHERLFKMYGKPPLEL